MVDEESAGEVGVEAEWEAADLEPGLAGSVFVPIVGRGYPIRWQRLAMILIVPNVEQRWLEVKRQASSIYFYAKVVSSFY